MKPDIVVVGKLFPKTQETLEREFSCHRMYEASDKDAFLKEMAPKARALATFASSGASAKLMDALPKLEIISNFGVGVDAIDVGAAKQRKIIVTNTPDVLNACVADTAMALILNALRRYPAAEGYLREGKWAGAPFPLTTSLGGKTLGILGMGRIGEAIAERAKAFGMKIRYHNRSRKKVDYAYDADAVTLAKNSDVLLVATPGGPETAKLVNAKVMDALGAQGYLVNIARGSVLDEAAVLEYLKTGKIAGAGLDVFESEPKINPEWFGIRNAVVFPHVASATVETRTAMGELQIENLRLHFAGKPVKTPVA